MMPRPESCRLTLNQNRKVCAPGESGRSILLFVVIDTQHLLFVGVFFGIS